MRKLFTFLFALATSVGMMWAQGPWTSGDCTVTLSGGVITVSGSGAMADYHNTTPWDSYKSSITSIVIEDGVTHVGNETFCVCENLVSVTIGNDVETIGEYAFDDCYKFTTLTLGNSIQSIGECAFMWSKELTELNLPASLQIIGNNAFLQCKKITTVTIPSSVTSIGSQAFYYCTALTSIYAEPTTPPTLGEGVFTNVPTSIPLYVPNGSVDAYTEAAQWNAFNIQGYDPEPEEPEIVNHVQIGDLYYNLKNDNKTAEVTYEEFMSETNYSSLTAVNIPESVEYNSVTYSVTSIGMGAFVGCTGLTSITIPSSVTSIGDGAFQSCEGLTSIEIPNSVTSIGGAAFYGCIGLTSVTIGNSVTSIGMGAFLYCTSLTSITIPSSVTSIGEYAFEGCSNLASVTILAESLESYGSGAFEGTAEGLKIYVPAGSVDTYKDAENWSAYKDKIKAIPAPKPAWVRDGDEWDDATKTLTVNSNPIDYAYSGGVSVIENLVISDAVTSIGASAFAECTGLTSITIPNNVASIGVGAFAGCSGLTSMVVASGNTKYDSRGNCNAIIETSTNTLIAGCQNTIIPNSVTSIGEGAFFGCTGLTSVTIPNSVNSIGQMAFAMCGLTSIEIPGSVTSIGDMAFASCSNLASVTILAESLESYGTDAFDGTAAALKIYVPAASVDTYKAAENWSAYADKIVAIPPEWVLPGDEWDDATKTLTVNSNPGSSAYSNVSDIENLVISDAVTSIGEKAFFGCEGLTSVTIGNSVTSIGEAVFVLCTGLTSIEVASGNTTYDSRDCNAIIETSSNTLIAGCKSTIIPNSVTSIGEYAFEYCKGLTSITIPNSVTSIGQSAFSSCSGLKSVTIGNSVKSIGGGAFMECEGLTSVTIGNSVESIGEWAFLYCSSLTSITIPNSVTSIGQMAFAGCTGLTSIEIPNSSIGGGAFYGCTGLTSVTIGNSVTSIGEGAFYECSGLEKVTILAESLESYGSVAFEGTAEGLKIYVPAGSVDTYKDAWSAYADKIKAIPPAWVRDGDEWDDATKTLTVNSDLPNAAYMGKDVIEHVIISDGITSIADEAFYGCEGLTSVTIGNSVTSIGYHAFADCHGLTSIEIPNSVESIGAEAFAVCISLTSITIPNSVTSIGAAAFAGCFGLTSMVVASGNTKYDSRDNCNAIIETSSKTLITGCKSTIIPSSVTSIGLGAFYFCKGLTSIEIPNGVTSIGQMAFGGCSDLTSVTIGNSVISIGADAFNGCTAVTDVYCYPNAANLTWDEDGKDDFKDDGSTVCHVHADQLSAYQEKFTDEVNVTFVGDLPNIPTNAQEVSVPGNPAQKLIREGNLYILRDGKTYTITGQAVK